MSPQRIRPGSASRDAEPPEEPRDDATELTSQDETVDGAESFEPDTDAADAPEESDAAEEVIVATTPAVAPAPSVPVVATPTAEDEDLEEVFIAPSPVANRRAFGRLFHGETRFDFVRRKRVWFIISAVVIAAGAISLATRGLNLGIDFVGGTSWQVSTTKPLTTPQVESALGTSLTGETIIFLGSQSTNSTTLEVSAKLPKGQTLAKTQQQEQSIAIILSRLTHHPLTNGVANAVSIESVGPSWGAQITHKAIVALIVFFILIAIYISLFFEWRMAFAAIVAVLHDILVTVGIYSLTGLEVTPDTVVAFLTILGYSLYDTIVVFDRVRDNVKNLTVRDRLTYSDIVNVSMNQTLARSINTSLVAIMPILAVLVLGAEILGATTLQYFGLALLVGLTTGAYSSIFIASPLVALVKEREPRYRIIRERLESRGYGHVLLSARAVASNAYDDEPGMAREERRARRASEAASTGRIVPSAGSTTGTGAARTAAPARASRPAGRAPRHQPPGGPLAAQGTAALIDVRAARQEPSAFREALTRKGAAEDFDAFLALDESWRALTAAVDELRAKTRPKGRPSPEELTALGILKATLKEKEEELEALEARRHDVLIRVPNPPDASVPDGSTDDDAIEVRRIGAPPTFAFTPHDHLALGGFDTERAVRLSGARFAYRMGDATLVELALYRFALQALVDRGFVPVLPPVLVREEAMYGTGFLPNEAMNLYRIESDDLYLTGTSEVALAGMHLGEILEEGDLPLRYAGYSTCFRREAGAAGRDTRGIFRVHQFDKVEMFVYCLPEASANMHEELLAIEESLVTALGLSYRVVNIAAGDLGAPATKKYDIEAWIPTEQRYREISSCSNTTDYQARRLGIRCRDQSGALVTPHTLNGTAMTARWLIALLESFQDEAGAVAIPDVLVGFGAPARLNARPTH